MVSRCVSRKKKLHPAGELEHLGHVVSCACCVVVFLWLSGNGWDYFIIWLMSPNCRSRIPSVPFALWTVYSYVVHIPGWRCSEQGVTRHKPSVMVRCHFWGHSHLQGQTWILRSFPGVYRPQWKPRIAESWDWAPGDRSTVFLSQRPGWCILLAKYAWDLDVSLHCFSQASLPLTCSVVQGHLLLCLLCPRGSQSCFPKWDDSALCLRPIRWLCCPRAEPCTFPALVLKESPALVPSLLLEPHPRSVSTLPPDLWVHVAWCCQRFWLWPHLPLAARSELGHVPFLPDVKATCCITADSISPVWF